MDSYFLLQKRRDRGDLEPEKELEEYEERERQKKKHEEKGKNKFSFKDLDTPKFTVSEIVGAAETINPSLLMLKEICLTSKDPEQVSKPVPKPREASISIEAKSTSGKSYASRSKSPPPPIIIDDIMLDSNMVSLPDKNKKQAGVQRQKSTPKGKLGKTIPKSRIGLKM